MMTSSRSFLIAPLPMLAWGMVIACAVCVSTSVACAQDNQSGALTFPAGWTHSAAGYDGVTFGARAMAVDRVPQTVVGRFGELHGNVGIDFAGTIFSYAVGVQLGVGLATDYFVAFVASGVVFDAFQSIDGASEADDVPPGVGIPAAAGLWLTLTDGLYAYGLYEQRWVPYVEARDRGRDGLCGLGEECVFRGGIAAEIDDLHIRLEYRYHAVAPGGWHMLTLGFGGLPNTAAPKL